MQDVLIALFIGLILGWIIEWLIDWRYWRPTVTALRRENAHLRHQLDACTQADGAPAATPATNQAASQIEGQGK